jgi:hypothetical protein
MNTCVWSEPKPYQQALIDEPLSIMDFMIYKNRVRLEEHVSKYILDPKDTSYPSGWGEFICSYFFKP